MRFRNFHVALVAVVLTAGAASAQETDQETGAPAPAEAAAATDACIPATPPPRLMITMPKEPAMPACAQKNTCSKAAADSYNLAILNYNKAIAQANNASGEYVDKLNAYAREAGRYANCEIDRLNRMTMD